MGAQGGGRGDFIVGGGHKGSSIIKINLFSNVIPPNKAVKLVSYPAAVPTVMRRAFDCINLIFAPYIHAAHNDLSFRQTCIKI